MSRTVDTTYPAEGKVTLHVSLDVHVPPRFTPHSRQQQAFDAAYFAAVVQRLVVLEAGKQYADAVTFLRKP